MTRTINTDVAVIGAGPAGLALSIELSRYGVDHVLIDHRTEINPHPRASIVNTRTGEILRRWGLADRVDRRALPRDRGHSVYFADSFAGQVRGVIGLAEDLERFARRIDASPAVLTVVAQDELEPILWEAALDSAHVTILRGHHVDQVATPKAPRLLLTSADGPVEVASTYVAAADGAAGTTREQMGIATQGPGVLGSQLNIYLRADLSHLTTHRPAMLMWVLDPAHRGVFVALNGTDRWCFHTRLESGQLLGGFDEATCRGLVSGAVGDAEVEIEILSIAPWFMRAEVACTYRRDNVVLVGDAAHVMPPTGGFGMNTAIQDAHALGWRLAGLIQGWCDEGVLDGYVVERRPVAWRNTMQSTVNLDALTRLGLDLPRVASGPRLSDDELAAAVTFQRDHFDFLNQELGYVYTSGNVTSFDGPPADDNVSDYRPDGRPGARLPHVWVASPDGLISSLDLVADTFTLFTDSHGMRRWSAAVAGLGNRIAPVSVIELGDDAALRTSSQRWSDLTGTPPGGALLVRPDGHIAARFTPAAADPMLLNDRISSYSMLADAMATATGRLVPTGAPR